MLKQNKINNLKEEELLISDILDDDKIYIDEENKIKIYKLNIDNSLYVKKYFSNQTLYNIRNDLNNLINTNYHFYIEDKMIEIEDENNITINNLSDSIYIKKDKILKNKPIEGSILLLKQKNLKQLYLYPNINEIDDNNSLSILLIGEKGNGKKTLINSLINYIMNIKYEDDFRYLINNKISNIKQNNINIYNIKKTKNIPSIKIIDIPSINEENENQIINKIKYIMNNKRKNINAIYFVNNNNKINIFNNILNLFGTDIIENILIMFTYCNNKKPLILNQFEEQNSNFNIMRNGLKKDCYFKFNNSIILNNKNDENSKRIWEMNMNNFEKFIKKLQSLP